MKTDRIESLNHSIISQYPKERIVLGYGNINSSIMLIGEAPGSKEVELGEPFVGQAGKHFEEFIKVLNINREDVYITNTVKYRPTRTNPKTGRLSNRTPTLKEIEDFKSYLIEEIDIVSPKIIVTLGNTPLKCIFSEDLKIGKIHGNSLDRDIKGIKYDIFPLYHPAAVIYRPQLKEVYLDDLLKLKKIIEKL
ncbi:uracil-DNA glycosylase [Clostridium sp. Cult3]|uniref:uracil-DNA glycosylase n=1 Tax=Clostridium sp. Cult3 TaxID=2079004 RepID=UPI001F3FBF87|nr:uracil-DNA glycosylase [Clostridium sp. Cult3]